MDRRSERRMFPSLDSTEIVESVRSGDAQSGGTKKKDNRETRENLPLKQATKYSQRKSCCNSDNSLKAIILAISVFSFAVTIALIVQIHYEDFPTQSQGVVVSDSPECSDAGISMLRRGGSAVDAAVATLLCLGVVHPHATGLGGGGFMLIHSHSNNLKTEVFDFRETAPDTVSSLHSESHFVGVPGQLHGLYMAHQVYGKLLWSDVVQPAIDIAFQGFNLSLYLREALDAHSTALPLSAVLENQIGMPDLGELIRRPSLGRTLKKLAEDGVAAFYGGDVGQQLIEELRNMNVSIDTSDLKNYTTVIRNSLSIKWKGYTIHSAPSPSSGPALLIALNLMKNSSFSSLTLKDRFKVFIEALRTSSIKMYELGDPREGELIGNLTQKFINESDPELFMNASMSDAVNMTIPGGRETRGSNVVALDNKEMFVTIVSGLGSWFGSKLVTSTGIVLNDALNDFSNVDVHENKFLNNLLQPGNRPLSSYLPVLVFETSNVCGERLALGGSSNTLVLQPLLNKLVFNMTTQNAVDNPRFDVSEDKILCEPGETLNSETLEELSSLGLSELPASPPYISINMISKKGDQVSYHADRRGSGAGLEL